MTEEQLKSLEQSVDESIAEYNNYAGTLTGYDCPICKNNGYIAKKIYSFGMPTVVYVECSCLAKRKAINAKNSSNIANLLAEYNFENFNTNEQWQKSMLDTARAFVDNNARFLFVGGQVGCGKTRLCVSALNALIDKGAYSFRTILWVDLVRRLKALAFNESAYDKAFNAVVDCPLLFIDDFLKFTNNERDIEIAFSIINARYNAGKKTIISSEHTGEDLIKLDEALGSRIYQYAGNYFISIDKDLNKNIRFKE